MTRDGWITRLRALANRLRGADTVAVITPDEYDELARLLDYDRSILELRRTADQLQRYVRHREECESLWVISPQRPCTCGLTAVLDERSSGVGCMDCALPYTAFPMDVVLPRAQWLAIHPAENGLLCAQCIVARASRLAGATCMHAIIEITPHRQEQK